LTVAGELRAAKVAQELMLVAQRVFRHSETSALTPAPPIGDVRTVAMSSNPTPPAPPPDGRARSINESARLTLDALYEKYKAQGDRRFRVTAASSILREAGLSEAEAGQGLRRLAEKSLVVEGDRGVFSLETLGVDEREHEGRLDELLPLPAPSRPARPASAPEVHAPDDPLARLKTTRATLAAHREGTCPKCQGHSLRFEDKFEVERDTVIRTWSCGKCDFMKRAHGIPISEWETSTQKNWYRKAAAQRAKDELIRCPTCGQESIEAEEAGVKAIGTSSHVWLSCKTRNCDFVRRKVPRSALWTLIAYTQYAAVLAVVLGGVWIAKKLLASGLETGQAGGQATPTPVATAPSATPTTTAPVALVPTHSSSDTVPSRSAEPQLRPQARPSPSSSVATLATSPTKEWNAEVKPRQLSKGSPAQTVFSERVRPGTRTVALTLTATQPLDAWSVIYATANGEHGQSELSCTANRCQTGCASATSCTHSITLTPTVGSDGMLTVGFKLERCTSRSGDDQCFVSGKVSVN
jgi:hypothetical protein